jgi:protoheme IX farnesyltransferase
MICKPYIALTKPGIVVGNLIPMLGGFFLASQGKIETLWAAVIGLALVMGSACVWNNYFDRAADQKMERTQSRPLVRGDISERGVLWLGCLLGALGFLILAAWTPWSAVFFAVIGFAGYVVLYGISKYKTYHATLLGSIAGAMPVLVGYTAFAKRVDGAALILFAMMVLWQMPHFYAIAIRRLKDYQAASIPVLPAVRGIFVTKVQMVLYVIAFGAAASLLYVWGYAGVFYLWVVCALASGWTLLALLGLRREDDEKWAKEMFIFSLVVVLGVFGSMIL